jgi:hypothetical protein
LRNKASLHKRPQNPRVGLGGLSLRSRDARLTHIEKIKSKDKQAHEPHPYSTEPS